MEGPGEDPRPPWVYTGTRLMSFVIIPAVGLYSVFFYDFGDHEHVFQPPRRWAKSLINEAFTLSSAEEKLLLQEKQQQMTTTASSEKAL
ncbi:hypothetical protein CPC08DRAFT_707492 [Agrocybe pediades]|nr:hypothetical protein CPC08DRAFT_707492 [Agrocybe pediades]